jgi:hypothetical protein
MTACHCRPLAYRIVVRGESPALLASLGENVRVEFLADGNTTLVVSLADDSAFWGLMDRFADHALHLVSLQELGFHEEPHT